MAELDRVKLIRETLKAGRRATVDVEDAEVLLNRIDSQAADIGEKDNKIGELQRAAQVRDGIIRILGRKAGSKTKDVEKIISEHVTNEDIDAELTKP